MCTFPLSKRKGNSFSSYKGEKADFSRVAFNSEWVRSLSQVLLHVVTIPSGIRVIFLNNSLLPGARKHRVWMWWERGDAEVRWTAGQSNSCWVGEKSWSTSDWMLSKESQAYMTGNYTYLRYAITKCQPDIKLLYRGIMSLNSLLIICVPGVYSPPRFYDTLAYLQSQQRVSPT